MNERKAQADRLVRQKVILDVLGEANSELRSEVRLGFLPGDAEATELGRVRMDKPRKSARVHDWAALDRWVRENIPGGIITTEAINPALVAALCKAEGEWTNPETGEVVEVPGIGITEHILATHPQPLCRRLLRTPTPSSCSP